MLRAPEAPTSRAAEPAPARAAAGLAGLVFPDMRARAARLALAVLVSGLVLVLAARLAAAFLDDVRWLRLLDNLHWTVSYSAGAALAWIGARAARGSERRARTCFAGGLSAYALGQMLWDVQVATGWNPFPGPSDLFFLALGPCFAVGLAEQLRARIAAGRRRSTLLDATGLCVSVLALTLALYLPRRGDVGWLQLVTLVAYPVFLLSAACLVVVLVLALRAGFDRRWSVFLVALLLNGFVWLRWNTLTLDGALTDGTFYNSLFSFTALVQGVGAATWRIEESSERRHRLGCAQAERLLPVLVPLVGATGFVLATSLPGVPVAVKLSIGVGAGVVLVTALLRQSLLNTELEQRVAERTAELQAANRELETFAYSVSHDLKAPLRGIEGYSALLQEDQSERLDDEGRRQLATVRRAAQQMSRLIDDLLAYSRLDRREMRRLQVDVRALVEGWRAERQAELEQAGVQLELDLGAPTPRADPDGLAMALRNLLENALKFSRRAARPVIAVAARETPAAWIVSVRDNGIGFDMRFHDRIFEIFQRLNRDEDYPGTGVGLAIVRRSLERMNGRVWAESQPGAGATFFLEIPK